METAGDVIHIPRVEEEDIKESVPEETNNQSKSRPQSSVTNQSGYGLIIELDNSNIQSISDEDDTGLNTERENSNIDPISNKNVTGPITERENSNNNPTSDVKNMNLERGQPIENGDTEEPISEQGDIDYSNSDGRSSKFDLDSDESDIEIENGDKGEHTDLQRRATFIDREKTEMPCLMTEDEIAELDKRFEEVLDRLQKQREEHRQWESDLSARRTKAFTRLKALGSRHDKRLEMYDKVKGFIHRQSVKVSK